MVARQSTDIGPQVLNITFQTRDFGSQLVDVGPQLLKFIARRTAGGCSGDGRGTCSPRRASLPGLARTRASLRRPPGSSQRGERAGTLAVERAGAVKDRHVIGACGLHDLLPNIATSR